MEINLSEVSEIGLRHLGLHMSSVLLRFIPQIFIVIVNLDDQRLCCGIKKRSDEKANVFNEVQKGRVPSQGKKQQKTKLLHQSYVLV